MKMRTRQVVIAGILASVALILGSTPLGFIPVPTAAGHATIMHIPAIIGAILEGPVVGAFIGLVFGLYSFLRGGAAMFADPVIAVVPRVLIGIVAYYVYKPLRKNLLVGSAAAAVAGTLTNTIGVLGLAYLRGYFPTWQAAGAIALIHGTPEVIVAGVLVVALVKALAAARFAVGVPAEDS
ncbi:MAG TPA: ECF transporter S component [Clostridia bacterium]|nr:ECF transporter S component [Clostridia bacterium]